MQIQNTTAETYSAPVILQHASSGERYAVIFREHDSRIVKAAGPLSDNAIIDVLAAGDFDSDPDLADELEAGCNAGEYDNAYLSLAISDAVARRAEEAR